MVQRSRHRSISISSVIMAFTWPTAVSFVLNEGGRGNNFLADQGICSQALGLRERPSTCQDFFADSVNIGRYTRNDRLRTKFELLAKKKKGAASLAQLEALEAQEALLFGDDIEKEEPKKPVVVGKAAKKNKKKGPKGVDTDALLADLEAEEQEAVQPVATSPKAEKTSKKKKKGPKGVDAEALLANLDIEEENKETEAVEAPAKQSKGGKKKKKGPKGIDAEALLANLDEEEEQTIVQEVTLEQEEQTVEEDLGSAVIDLDLANDAEDSEVEDEEGLEIESQTKETKEDRMKRERPPPRVRISSGTQQPGYVSLRLENIAVTFKNQDVLTDATWEVKTGDRVGLVGVNGGGKTTQLKILAGELEPLSGEIIKSSKDLRISYLKQEFIDELDLERTLKEELLSVFSEEFEVMRQLEQCQIDLEEAAAGDLSKMDDIMEKMNKFQTKADNMKVDTLESRVQKVMNQMGFVPSDAEEKVSAFSGGWKMRIGLGKILLQDPNVLLLDEPTNHLDIESVEWMENFLKNQNLPMVIVSHDREFLDQVCTSIVDCEAGVTNQYDGNYSRFLKLKKARMDSWEAAWQNQEKKIKEDESFIKRFKTISSKASAVQSRQKAIERLKNSPEYVRKPPRPGKPFKFRFPPAPRSSGEMIILDELSHGYDGNTLFEDLNLAFERGDRVAFLGPNGAGKSTLLRLMVGVEEPLSGTAETGGANVKINYFEQNQADALNLDLNVLQTIEEVAVGIPYNEIRALLGQFLFKGDSVYKKVSNLSGGEKGRLSLCRMMMQPANVLVLDEPTNHLDIPAKEMLEEALRYYDGTVLVVSHDRYFISQVANTICDIVDKDLEVYPGDYRYYMEKNREMKEKIESRYVEGVEGIKAMPKVEIFAEEVDEKVQKKKKNFGGKGGPSGNKNKGIKNAKRQN